MMYVMPPRYRHTCVMCIGLVGWGSSGATRYERRESPATDVWRSNLSNGRPPCVATHKLCEGSDRQKPADRLVGSRWPAGPASSPAGVEKPLLLYHICELQDTEPPTRKRKRLQLLHLLRFCIGRAKQRG